MQIVLLFTLFIAVLLEQVRVLYRDYVLFKEYNSTEFFISARSIFTADAITYVLITVYVISTYVQSLDTWINLILAGLLIISLQRSISLRGIKLKIGSDNLEYERLMFRKKLIPFRTIFRIESRKTGSDDGPRSAWIEDRDGHVLLNIDGYAHFDKLVTELSKACDQKFKIDIEPDPYIHQIWAYIFALLMFGVCITTVLARAYDKILFR